MSRQYQKEDTPVLEFREISEHDGREIEDLEFKDNPRAKSIEFQGRSYTKPLEGDRDYFLIILIVEDSQRTQKYFAPIAERNIRGVQVISIKDKRNGIPASHMYDKALECTAEYGLKVDAGDELYMLCDVDHYRRQLIELYKKKDINWTLIISNPCIEIWFYYGKINERPDLHVTPFLCPDKTDEISQAFKKYLGEQIVGGVDPRKAILDIESASINSKRHYAEDDDKIPVLYSTNMFILAERLLYFIKSELVALKSVEEKRSQEYKEKLMQL